MTTVNDYNQLMKDFPLNDLLSATELDRIRVSLQAIFLHLRKIRPTKYPIQRALRLVEAISRDLSTQLLKVYRFIQLLWTDASQSPYLPSESHSSIFFLLIMLYSAKVIVYTTSKLCKLGPVLLDQIYFLHISNLLKKLHLSDQIDF